MKLTILVVDDEASILELVSYHLNKAGYDVVCATQGEKALDLTYERRFDLAIVDIMMPVIDGYQLARELKASVDNMPIIMLSAKSETIDKVKAFEIGVDDYIAKPFDPQEMLARVNAVLKRYQKINSQIIHIGQTTLDSLTGVISSQGTAVTLPLKQFQLVFEMAKKPNQIFTREQLIELIWGVDYEGFDRTVDVHIKRVRENLAFVDDFKVVTIRGLGYKVEVTV